MTTDRRAAPVYRQVESDLRRRIRDGGLAAGQRLPTETELAAEWGVNRLTIRQALGELARAGYIVVRQGSGTYVAEQPRVFELTLPRMPSTDADAGSTASIAENVRHDQTETLVEITDRDTAPDAADALETAGPSVRVDTVVRTGDLPFFVCSYWLDAERFPGFVGHVTDRVALFQILQEQYGLRLRHAWRSLAASVTTREDAVLLEVPPGSPVMLRWGVNVDDARTPTMYLRRRLRGDRVRFTVQYESG